MKELISIIVLNYNGKQYLNDCLSSILNQDYKPFELILVDNASSDGSAEFVKEEFSSVKIVFNEKNYGYAEGNNIGVNYASGRYIVLVNNDVVVAEKWLEELYSSIKSGAIAVDSLVYNEGDPEYLYEKNGTLNILGHNIPGVFSDPEKTFYASGCSMIFDKEKMGKPFDGDYFAYQEDVALGWKIRLRGGRVMRCPESKVYHLGSQTARKIPCRKITFFQERNRILNLLIFYEIRTLLKISPLLVFETLLRATAVIILRKKSFLGFIQAYSWLMFNFKSVFRKRRLAQKGRTVGDEQILTDMSCRLVVGNNVSAKIINRTSKCYCRLLNLRTYEFQ